MADMKRFVQIFGFRMSAPAITAAVLLAVSGIALAYTVKPGDSLWKIAKSNSVSVTDLKKANGLSGDTIYPGQELKVPGKDTSGQAGSPGGTYTVRSGDTLWRIAQTNGVSVADLKSANNLTSDVLQPGQVLKIPGKAGTSTGTSTGSPPATTPPATTPPATPPTTTTAQDPDFQALKQQISDYLATQPATYKVYFKDLQTGSTFGIGEWDWMVGASSTKVPTVLYLYNLAASGKIDLNEKVAYQDSDFQDGAGGMQFYVKSGDQFTLQFLAHQAITVSDNIAHRMLLRRLGKDNVAAFMKNLGGTTVYPNGQNITTAHDLATYMQAALDFADRNPKFGGTLLYDLEHTIWNAGLNGALPSSVTVAHKEGDVIGVSNDVGVVYGSRPYLLVVMSSNQADSDKGFDYIAHISKLAYDYEESLAGAKS